MADICLCSYSGLQAVLHSPGRLYQYLVSFKFFWGAVSSPRVWCVICILTSRDMALQFVLISEFSSGSLWLRVLSSMHAHVWVPASSCLSHVEAILVDLVFFSHYSVTPSASATSPCCVSDTLSIFP